MLNSINGLKRVAIAVSGGVDSSVAAYLLTRSLGQNNVFGLHMSNWNSSDEDSHKNYCEQSEQDANDAETVCKSLGIEMKRVEFVSEYWNGVFEPFVQALGEQRMVNPDVGCNSIVKFGVMRDYAMQKGASHIATGHYARLWHRNESCFEIESLVKLYVSGLPEEEWIYNWGIQDGKNPSPLLLSGADLSKDQSYFLCAVNGIGLSNAIFPLGELIKKHENNFDDHNTNTNNGSTNNSEMCFDDMKSLQHMSVREIAEKAGLPTASKKESMGICFVGKRKFSDFISQYLPHEPVSGDFIDIDTGEIVGKHSGSVHFTVGQGAKISGASKKWFIAKKDRDGNVFVCDDTHHPSLYSTKLYVHINDFSWITGEAPPPIKEGRAIVGLCRTRHLQPLIPCVVSLDESHVVIQFDRPVRAITPGQTAAIYVGKGLICCGGGQIFSHGPTFHELGKDLPPILHPSGHNDLSLVKARNKC